MGEARIASWFMLGSVPLLEIAAAQGVRLFVLDRQHGLWNPEGVFQAIKAVPADAQIYVRVAENNAHAIGEALDAGAHGVIVPMVETAEEAARAVAAARFPPEGNRSGGGVRPMLGNFADYVAGPAKRIQVAVMIETRLGLENAAAIAQTDGLDFVFIGSYDLALSLGGDPEQACAAILAACRESGLNCGRFTPGPQEAKAAIAAGYKWVVGGYDIGLVSAAYRDVESALRD